MTCQRSQRALLDPFTSFQLCWYPRCFDSLAAHAVQLHPGYPLVLDPPFRSRFHPVGALLFLSNGSTNHKPSFVPMISHVVYPVCQRITRVTLAWGSLEVILKTSLPPFPTEHTSRTLWPHEEIPPACLFLNSFWINSCTFSNSGHFQSTESGPGEFGRVESWTWDCGK